MVRSHLHASALTCLLIAAGASVAMTFASSQGDSTRMNRFLDTFILTVPNDIRDAGNPLAGTRFDLTSFTTHPCYQIIGSEAKLCERQYGITQDLKDLLENGTVIGYMRQKGLVAETSPNTTPNMSSPTTVSSTYTGHMMTDGTIILSDTEYKNLISLRGKQLWVACGKKFKDSKNLSRCYQRNIRLISRFSTPLVSNIDF